MHKKLKLTAFVVALFGGALCNWSWSSSMVPEWRSSPLIASAYAAKHDESSSALIGNWKGQILTPSGRTVSLKMHISADAQGLPELEMIYGGARSCTLDGLYEGWAQGESRFSLRSRGGIYCDKLSTLSLMMQPDSTLFYIVRDWNGNVVESGKVMR